MSTFFHFLKKKLFATYEYNDEINRLQNDICSLKKQITSIATDSIIEIDKFKLSNEYGFNSIESKMHRIESKVNLISKNSNVGGGKIKVVFLVNNINAWYAISDVILEMKKRKSFHVIVASINKKFPGQSDFSGEDDVSFFLNKLKVEHIRLGMKICRQALDILISINPDIIFRQSQWDVDYPENLSSISLSFTRLAIIPYDIANIIKNVPYQDDIMDSAIDSEFHRRCWRVYCSSDYVKENAKKNGAMNGSQFYVSGHPKIDHFLKLKPINPFNTKNKKRILWSPHHSIYNGWNDFGMFVFMWEYMLSITEKNNAIDFIFCPHPALITQLKYNNNIEGFNYDDFINEWDSLDNRFSYFGAEYAELLCECDLVITDGISMLLECQIINKDILFVERDGHVAFNNIGEKLLSGLFRTRDVKKVESIMLKILNGNLGSLKDQQRLNIANLFPRRNSHEIICNDIEHSLSIKATTAQ